MSRTDKDRPYYTDAEWWEPYHYQCGKSYRSYFGTVRTTPARRQCDLPPEPIIAQYQARRRHNGRGCSWDPAYPPGVDEHGRDRVHVSVPKWFVDHIWNNPSRVRARDECRQAAKEYRASGEVDVVPTTDQHRHCAGWAWY